MGENKAQLSEEIANVMQRMARTWKFDPEVWLDLKLTTAQLKSLFLIDFMRSTNFKNLSDALGVAPPSITEVVDRLVERGLVSREENPDNRRMQILKTTDNGKALIAKLTESRISMISSLLEKLSLQDLSTLAQIFTSMVESVENGQDKQGNGRLTI